MPFIFNGMDSSSHYHFGVDAPEWQLQYNHSEDEEKPIPLDMNGVLTAANKNRRSIGGNFTNFYRSASSVDSVSQEIYSQQAFYIYYTFAALETALRRS